MEGLAGGDNVSHAVLQISSIISVKENGELIACFNSMEIIQDGDMIVFLEEGLCDTDWRSRLIQVSGFAWWTDQENQCWFPPGSHFGGNEMEDLKRFCLSFTTNFHRLNCVIPS